MLQTGGGSGEVDRPLRRILGKQREDQARGKGVAAADPIDDLNLVMPAAAATVLPAEHRRPAVDRRRDGLAERHGDAVEVEPPPQQFGHVLFVFGLRQSARSGARPNSSCGSSLPQITTLHVGQERRQRPARLFHAPQLAAVVAVATDRDAQPPGGRQSGGERLDDLLAQRRAPCRKNGTNPCRPKSHPSRSRPAEAGGCCWAIGRRSPWSGGRDAPASM